MAIIWLPKKGVGGFIQKILNFGGQAYKLWDDPAKSGTVGKYVKAAGMSSFDH